MNVVIQSSLKNKLLTDFFTIKSNSRFLLDSFVNLLDSGHQPSDDFMVAARSHVFNLVCDSNQFEHDLVALKHYIAELELAVVFYEKNYEPKSYLKENEINDIDDFDLG